MRVHCYRTPLRWAVLDLDGTLKVERDPYMFLHRRLGTAAEAEVLLQDGLSGRIPYRQWLEQDVALWRDQPLSRLRALLQEDPYRPGAAALVRELRRRRLELAIVSSGPSIHAELVAEELGVPRVVANEVLVRDGLVTGEVGRCVPLHGKGLVVQGLLEAWGADPAQTLALGDSESDIAVFGLVGLAVAVCPQSPKVVQAADLSWDGQGLQPLLQALRDLDPALFP
ncbi:MAG: HAD-IB family phosphatase [Chloroflexi bacterium]|nr:HAD-IB family phosphatase [Chloroflexota bacterium]